MGHYVSFSPKAAASRLRAEAKAKARERLQLEEKEIWQGLISEVFVERRNVRRAIDEIEASGKLRYLIGSTLGPPGKVRIAFELKAKEWEGNKQVVDAASQDFRNAVRKLRHMGVCST